MRSSLGTALFKCRLETKPKVNAPDTNRAVVKAERILLRVNPNATFGSPAEIFGMVIRVLDLPSIRLLRCANCA